MDIPSRTKGDLFYSIFLFFVARFMTEPITGKVDAYITWGFTL